MKIDHVSPHDIHPGINFRKDDESISEEFYNSIIEEGVKEPVLVFREKETDHLVLIDGWRRWSASRKAVEQNAVTAGFLIPCVIDDTVTNRDEAADKGLLGALTSKRHDPAQKSVAVHKLVRSRSMSIESVSKSFGISMSTVRRYVATHDGALDEVILAFERGHINLDEAHTLSLLAPDRQVDALETLLNGNDKKGALARIKRTVLRKNNKPNQSELVEVMKLANKTLQDSAEDANMSSEALAAQYSLRILQWVRGESDVETLEDLLLPIKSQEEDTASLLDELALDL